MSAERNSDDVQEPMEDALSSTGDGVLGDGVLGDGVLGDGVLGDGVLGDDSNRSSADAPEQPESPSESSSEQDAAISDVGQPEASVEPAAPAPPSGSPATGILTKKSAETNIASDALPTATGVTEGDDEVAFDWYVIRVQSGREDTLSSKIGRKLKLAGHDRFVRSVVVPKQKISEVRDGKKRVREMKLYPGYFFMEMQLVEEIWYLLRDTPGVGDFVGGGAKPIPMTASEVKKLVDVMEERERDEPPEIKIEVDKNDMVKIKEGPFENFEGVVEEVHPTKGQVRVMVTIFGRETPVDLEYWQVEKL